MGKLSKLLNRHGISFKVESNLAGHFIKSTTSATHYNVADEIVNELNAIKRGQESSHEETAALPLQNVSVSFSAEGMENVDKYHKQTLNKVNKLYKYLYDRTVCATELADQQEEVFVYLQLTDDVKEAYRKFRDSVCGLANER